MNTLDLIALLAAAFFAGLSGMLAWLWTRERGDAAAARDELATARTELNTARVNEARWAAQVEHLNNTAGHVETAFKAMSAEAVSQASQALLKQAEEHFVARDRMVQERLAIQLKPVADTLTKFEEQVKALEAKRNEEQGGLKEQIAALMAASISTQQETRKLAGALRGSAGAQGRWGEQSLRNVLETAGLSKRFDFIEQGSVDTEDGKKRPDVMVRMPGGGVFAIDAKCPWDAFNDIQEAIDDTARGAALMRHSAGVKGHISSLSAKAYWDQFKDAGSPDFVAMFLPGDGFLAAALEKAPGLMAEAMDRRVLIVTPTTLFALCKAVAYGWRVEGQAENAAQVAALGRELYKRLSVMGGHIARVGSALDGAVSNYNKFVGSLETQVLTQARRFEDLNVDHTGTEIPTLQPVETATRSLAKLVAAATNDEDAAAYPTLTLGNGAPTSPAA